MSPSAFPFILATVHLCGCWTTANSTAKAETAPVEDCSDSIDNDGDGLIDNQDQDCPLVGDVEWDTVDHAWLLDDPVDCRVHAFPLDGRPTFLTEVDGTLTWHDLDLILEDADAAIASAATYGESFWASVFEPHDIGDPDGDGLLDFVVATATPGQDEPPVVLRFSGTPDAIAPDEALLSIQAAWPLGTVPDADDDGLDDLLVLPVGEQATTPGVSWFPSNSTGSLDVFDDALAWVEQDYAELQTPQGISRLDADGDGFEEPLVYLERYEGTILEPHSGWVWILPASPTDRSTFSDESMAVVHDERLDVKEAAGIGDQDGDGYDDLAVAFRSEVAFFAGPFTGTLDEDDAVTVLHQIGAGDLATGDLDGDSDLEMTLVAEEGWLVIEEPLTYPEDTLLRIRTDDDGGLPFLQLFDINRDGMDDVLGCEGCLLSR